MRVLLTTRGSSGHLGPLAPFGHACVRAGHEVVVAAQRQHEANIERTGLAFAPVGDPPDEEWMPLMGSFAELDMATANALMISEFFAGIDLRAELPGLREIVESRRPDIIVRESWEFGSALVAELYGIPIVRVGLGLAAMEEQTIELAAPKLDQARAALGLPPDPTGERLRRAPYFTAIPEALENQAARTPRRTHRFRFGTSERTTPLPQWWPAADDRLVYLTFGSVAAAAHLPFFPDLYRGAIEALQSLPVRVLVTTGNDAGDADELGRLPPNIHVERWVPHDDAASEAAVIVCHGGYGSTLGALAHGVPLVVLPLFSSDQWANGDAVARSGVGVSLDGDRDTRAVLGLPSAETLGGLGPAVKNVLDDPAYGREARRLAEAMRALPAVDESIEALAGIAEE